MSLIPIFSSHYSLKSTLTLDECSSTEAVDTSYPISVFTLAKVFKFKVIYLVEKSFGGFCEAIKNSQKIGADLRFGLSLNICSDMANKSEDSIITESKVVVWMNNSAAYKDLIQIYTTSFKDGFYYHNRLDWKTLQSMWTENLSLSIPFYDSFLHNNLLKQNSAIVPDFGPIIPNIFIERQDLPFDPLIENMARNYAQNNNLETNEVHSIFYYDRARFKAYCIYRSILNKSCFDAPELDHFGSDSFCFERYLELNK